MRSYIKYLVYFFGLVLFSSCINKSSSNNQKQTNNLDSLEKCVLIDSFEISINILREGGFKPQAYEDDCVLKFVDKLSDLSIKDSSYFNDLNIISNISDGYLSEYFLDILIIQFYDNFDNLTDYLFLNKKSSLNNFLVEGLSMEVSDKGNEERGEIRKYINKKIESNKNQKYIEFIRSIEEKINPSMFD